MKNIINGVKKSTKGWSRTVRNVKRSSNEKYDQRMKIVINVVKKNPQRAGVALATRSKSLDAPKVTIMIIKMVTKQYEVKVQFEIDFDQITIFWSGN